jgi:hypothetical protein
LNSPNFLETKKCPFKEDKRITVEQRATYILGFAGKIRQQKYVRITVVVLRVNATRPKHPGRTRSASRAQREGESPPRAARVTAESATPPGAHHQVHVQTPFQVGRDHNTAVRLLCSRGLGDWAEGAGKRKRGDG